MRRYETIFISDPDLSEIERGQLFEKTQKLIPDYNGTLIVFDEWGILGRGLQSRILRQRGKKLIKGPFWKSVKRTCWKTVLMLSNEPTRYQVLLFGAETLSYLINFKRPALELAVRHLFETTQN